MQQPAFNGQPPPSRFRVGDLEVDTSRAQVTRDGVEIPLPKLSFDLLLALIEFAPRIATIDELLARVWPGLVVNPETVSQRVKLLRAALEDDSNEPRYISVVRGRGYRLVADVSRIEGADTHAGSEVPQAAIAQPQGKSKRFGLIASVVVGAGAVIAILVAALYLSGRATLNTSADATTSLRDRAIAVLPFANLSTEADSALFTDGMHDEVITALGKIAALKVIGRTSVLPYADPKQRNLKKIAADLGIGTVVEGTVRRSGNKVRIAVQLVDAQTSRQLWGDAYERELIDVFAIQAAIAQDVATQLDATLTADERTLVARRLTDNPRAHELYLQAKLLQNHLSPAVPRKEWERVTSLLDETVTADPGFAQAYALLSRIHTLIYSYAHLDPSPARRELARQALAAAQRLAPAAPETRLAEGRFAYACEDDSAKALSIYQPLLAELPNDDELLFNLGIAERNLGRHVEGAAAITRALALNPLDANKASALMVSLSMLRRFGEAVEIGERYQGTSAEYDDIVRQVDTARYELDGDRARLARSRQEHPMRRLDAASAVAAYEAALIRGDLVAAAEALSDPGLTTIMASSLFAEPAELHRALIAHLLGQREAAAVHAAKAIAYFRARIWEPRQQRYVLIKVAQATVAAGQRVEARRLAAEVHRAVAGKTGRADLWVLNQLGRTYALLGEREEALAILRTLMTGPNAYSGTPRMVRIDPYWSLLAADPRFDAILNAAKPL